MRNASTVQGLNPEQYRAATHLDGPLLILEFLRHIANDHIHGGTRLMDLS